MRDTVLGDLTLAPWPPAYSEANGYQTHPAHCLGYFFPAALVGKALGMGALDVALYCWTAIGASLFFLLLPLPRQMGWRLMAAVLVVIFFSGMDYLGIVLVTGNTPLFPLRLAWWVPFSFPRSPARCTGRQTMLFVMAGDHLVLPPLGSPHTTRADGHTAAAFGDMDAICRRGILPFLAIATIRWWSNNSDLRESGLTVFQLIVAAGLSYLTIRLLTLDIAAIPGAPTIDVAPNPDRFVLKYLVFILMEFVILALLIARRICHSQGLLWLAFSILALLPLYQYGPSTIRCYGYRQPARCSC